MRRRWCALEPFVFTSTKLSATILSISLSSTTMMTILRAAGTAHGAAGGGEDATGFIAESEVARRLLPADELRDTGDGSSVVADRDLRESGDGAGRSIFNIAPR